MAGTQRHRIGGVVLVCIAVGLFAAAFFSFTDHFVADWESYSRWSRRWIVFIGITLVGIAGRIVHLRNKEARRKHADRDAAREP